ncbi:hypothetical protein HPB47_021051 [Ixodes persulcatus]|uniref:Uncharacterized protein n=1 Tax=Ixodes persulcatus TaxID=34615 RepID=A0AC60QDT0_IXOPE|nr:hypothetical protein HPB47_021051 [Ixodes persulcatus]
MPWTGNSRTPNSASGVSNRRGNLKTSKHHLLQNALRGHQQTDESGSEYSEEGPSSDDESSTVPRAKRRQKDTPEDEEDDSSEGSDEGDLSPGDDGDDFEDTDEEVEVRQPAVAKGKRDKANLVVAESDDEVSDDDDDGESDDDLGSEESSDAGGPKVGKAERIRSGGKGEEKPGQKTASVSGKKHVAESSTDEGTDPDFSDEESAEGEDDESCDKLEDETPASGKKTPAAALKNKDGTWEDIYGRLRDKDGNVVSQKYVPPAKRLQSGQLDSKKKEELARLKKQLKGLLNRYFGLVRAITVFFTDMNSSLNLALCESIVSPFLSPERLVMEHAMLVAYLHCNVGTEVGAQILQDMAEKFNSLYEQGQNKDTSKEADNCILFISYLFVFKVVHSRIVFDLIRKLAEAFTEKDVELILLILRSVGFVLRKHDPLALKETVLLLQQKSAQDANTQDSRKRFMMDILNAVRNNNIQKIPNCDPSMVEHASKVLRGLFRKGCSLQELNISLDDLLKAHERGKWWVVGVKNKEGSKQPEFSSTILKLAQKHHMNTDIRKNIFCIIMTAEDYLDASERILRLNLSPTQEREVCHVLLHCALKEKRHNPYYVYLAQFFVKRDRRFHMTLQCALWDKFKEVDKLSPTESSNLAEFIVALLSQEALSLSVLKARLPNHTAVHSEGRPDSPRAISLSPEIGETRGGVRESSLSSASSSPAFLSLNLPFRVATDYGQATLTVHFVDMSPALLRFLRQLFVSLFVGRSETVCEKVFLKVAEVPKLHLLREGVRLFLRHFFLRDADQVDPSLRATLEERVASAEDVLSLGDKKAVL